MNKEKNNKKTYLIIGISLVLILLILITIFVINLNNDKKISEENMQIIKDNYNELSINVTEYNQVRTELSELLNNFIYENYKNEHEEYTNLLNKYNSNINKIDKNINSIESRCNVIYKDSAVNKICDSYKTLYEKLINLYVSDINNYNNKITSYNEYKKEEIELHKLIHQDYIDYDNNKEYEGKDVENEENNEEE